MIKYLDELKKEDLAGKKVLLRADLDVPVVGGKIQEDFRIKAQKETINYLINVGAKVLMVAHLGHDTPDVSFSPIVGEIGKILGHELSLVTPSEILNTKYEILDTISLLDNIRQDLREEKNDDGLARELAEGFDFYVNNTFAVMHRNHASVVAITKHLPSYAGFLIKKETEYLKQALEAPVEGKILVLGGAKISTKLPVIKNFVDRAEKILIGGALANNFFKYQGFEVGRSLVDMNEESETQLDLINLGSSQDPRWDRKIILPEDVLISDDKTGKSGVEPYPVRDIDSSHLILDIGPETVKHYAEIIGGAEMVVWNGPMGLSEVDAFASGTEAVARAASGARRSIISGGDTIAAVNKLGLLDKYDFVSTGGGAMLEFLAGNKLPGLEALEYYDPERDSLY